MVSGRLTFGRRVKLWPIMMMVVVIAAGIIALNSLVKAKDELHLSCEARFYKPFLTGDVPRKVSLDVLSKDKKVVIRYEYFVGDKPAGSIELLGKLLQLEVATMSYKMKITQGTVKNNIESEKLPIHLQQVLDSGGQIFANGGGFDLTLKMSEMDIDKGYAVVRFDPGNNIWACRINP